MTYICGYRDNGVNFIICDTRITWRDRRSEPMDVAVKSGNLFPGCIFARAGDMRTSAKFIAAVKNRVEAQLTPAECWSHFVDFVEEYPFSRGQFTLLLSTRATGQPEFFYLDSKEGLRVCQQGSIRGFGSGVQLLNPVVESSLRKMANIRQQLPDNLRDQTPVDLAGYFLCHGLSLYTQSYRKSIMENHGVGGIFHFMAQTSDQEYRQQPSLYLIAVFDPSVTLQKSV